MLERVMSETTPPSGAASMARAESLGTVEAREAPDHRTKVVNALNRTMDRAQKKRDKILERVMSSGSGLIGDDDAEVVLGYQYASEAVKKLTGGEDRLNYDVEGDTFKVPVKDQRTGEWYERDEGIPIGYLVRFADREHQRLAREMNELPYEDRSSLREERRQLFEDMLTLIRSSRHTRWSFINDYYLEGMPDSVKRDAEFGAFKSNREETEAYLRSQNPEIARLGGESPDQNMAKAMEDIGDIRRELIIPKKGVLDPAEKYKAPIASPPEITEVPEVVGEPREEEAEMITDRARARARERDDPGRDILEAALEKIGSGRERIRRFVSSLPRPGLRRALIWLGVAAGAAVVGYLSQDRNALTLEQAARVTQPPERGVAMPSSVSSASSGLVSPEIPRPEAIEVATGLKKRVKIDIPGRGKEVLNVWILTGNEPDIFNVPASPITPDTSQAAQTGVSSADVRRVIKNPLADDEIAKTIRSYLDEDTFELLRKLGVKEANFRTKGPEGERVKPDYASLRGWFDADWTTTALGRPFEMRSSNDLGNLEQLKKDPAYNQAWRLTVADQLLQSGQYNYDIIGFLLEGQEIVDVAGPLHSPKLTGSSGQPLLRCSIL